MTKSTKIISHVQQIETDSEWNDLPMEKHEKDQIQELVKWLKDNKSGSRSKSRNHLALFGGSSIEAKSITAGLLGKLSGQDVYRIDLSSIISKYIGETEKNLDAVFNKTKNLNGILFFDEADALFGKRSEVKDSHDRYANLEVSYLLKKIEDHNGLVILSVTSPKKVDESLLKRVKTIIEI